MKKILALMLTLVLVFSCSAAFAELTFTTGGSSGTYYAFGSVLGQFVTDNSDVAISAVTGEGSAADAAGILANGKDYLKIMLWGLVPFAFSTAYATTLRECGETLVPMISSFAGCASKSDRCSPAAKASTCSCVNSPSTTAR